MIKKYYYPRNRIRYTVTYDINGGTGTAPTDSTQYRPGLTVTVLSQGEISKLYYSFGGWNTSADGSGTNYTAGSGSFIITGDITLYAKWKIISVYIIMNRMDVTSSSGIKIYTFAHTATSSAGTICPADLTLILKWCNCTIKTQDNEIDDPLSKNTFFVGEESVEATSKSLRSLNTTLLGTSLTYITGETLYEYIENDHTVTWDFIGIEVSTFDGYSEIPSVLTIQNQYSETSKQISIRQVPLNITNFVTFVAEGRRMEIVPIFKKRERYYIDYWTTDDNSIIIMSEGDTIFGATYITNEQVTSQGETNHYRYVFSEAPTIIPRAAFQLSNIQKIIIPDSISDIDDYAFNLSNLSSITIGEGVKNIGERAFDNCKFTSIILPDCLENIKENAFHWCDNLTSIIIPNDIVIIETRTFFHCQSLISVTIPSGVTDIASEAFGYCSSLTSVTCEATTVPTLSGTNHFTNPSQRTLYVPSGSVQAYQNSDWAQYFTTITAITNNN